MSLSTRALMVLMLAAALAACGTPDAPSGAQPTMAPLAAAPTAPLATAPVATMPPPTERPGAPTLGPTWTPSDNPASRPNQPPAPCLGSVSDGQMPTLPYPTQPDQNAASIEPSACPTVLGAPGRTPSPLDQATDMAQAAVLTDVAQAGSVVGQPITSVAEVGVVEPAQPPEPLATPTPIQGPATIGMQDNQQTLYLSVGDTFTLALGSPMQWNVTLADERIVARESGAVGDTQRTYKALASGETTLTAQGEAPCRQSQPACMLPDILFQITIVVR